MMVDDIGNVTVTNDGATILKQIEVEHPAAKILVELAQTQDKAIGDGTTSVVIIAAELLKKAQDLIRNKIHPTSIISGYKLAAKKGIEFLKKDFQIPTSSLNKDALINVAKTTMSSKILGAESDFFAQMVVEAISSVRMINPQGKEKYPIKSINILKQHGRSMRESLFVRGYALNCTRASQGMPRRVKNAKIALLDINLNKQKMKLGMQVVINDPTKLEGIREQESTLIRDRIQMMFDAGANVIMTTKGIDDLCLKYFVENNAIGIRRVEKDDLKRIAKVTGGTVITSFADLEGNESFDPKYLGEAEEVCEETLASDNATFIRGCKNTKASSIVLRGPNEFMLDEMERTVHDAICAVKRVLESKFIVPGGGAVDAALSIYLENFATTLETREQLAIAEFAEAMLVIPKTLAVNAACDSTELVAKLRAYHNEAQKNKDKKKYSNYGLNLLDQTVQDNVEAGVLEPSMTKIKILQYATEAATTILRIDDVIKLNEKQQQQ